MPTHQKTRKLGAAPKLEARRATGMRRLTTAQAIVTFLQNQFVERDGVEHAFFARM